MEFIPLEKYSKKGKKKETVKKQSIQKKKTVKENEAVKEEVVKKSKAKPRTKVFEKKKVKNKYKETLELRQKQRVQKKKNKNLKEEEEKEKDEEEKEEKDEKEGEEEEEKMEVEDKETEEENEEDDSDEEAFKRKCQKLDEINKNRLFVRLKKKILNEAQIKELHPDIKSVVFPRKKNTRWCWAVFASKEKAHQAFQKLGKNKEVFVSKPVSHDRNSQRQKEKMKTVLRKKEARKKLQKMWS